MNSYGNAYAGAAFHCYAGSVGNQDQFHNAFPSKSIYFTECSGTFGSDWWSDIKASKSFGPAPFKSFCFRVCSPDFKVVYG